MAYAPVWAPGKVKPCNPNSCAHDDVYIYEDDSEQKLTLNEIYSKELVVSFSLLTPHRHLEKILYTLQ